jgi:hypothetical protein
MMSMQGSIKDFIPLLDLGKETKRWEQVLKILNEPKPDIIPTQREGCMEQK